MFFSKQSLWAFTSKQNNSWSQKLLLYSDYLATISGSNLIHELNRIPSVSPSSCCQKLAANAWANADLRKPSNAQTWIADIYPTITDISGKIDKNNQFVNKVSKKLPNLKIGIDRRAYFSRNQSCLMHPITKFV